MRSMIVAIVLVSAVTNSVRADKENNRLPKEAPSPLTAPFDAQQAKAGQEAWAKHLEKSSPVEKNSIGMELVLIPPGKFRMGSPPDEKDRHMSEGQVDVTITKSFHLGKTEVTQGQWQAVMGTTPWKGKDFVKEGDDYAATYVSWNDARGFCKKLSEKENGTYRLPTEAEWEYACRAGSTTRFSFGADDAKLGVAAWFETTTLGIGEDYAHQVGRKQANPFGLHDMHGNVWEQCEDVYFDELPGGTDPLVSVGGLPPRVYRGGCWSSEAAHCRSACRYGGESDDRDSSGGFRVVRSSGR